MRYLLFVLAVVFFISGCRQQERTPLEQAQQDFIAGRFDQAIGICDRILSDRPDDVQTRLLRGQIYFAKDDVPRAVDDYTAVINSDPSQYDAYYYRAMAYKKMGKKEKAFADNMQARKLDPSYRQTNAYFPVENIEAAVAEEDRTDTQADKAESGHGEKKFEINALAEDSDPFDDQSDESYGQSVGKSSVLPPRRAAGAVDPGRLQGGLGVTIPRREDLLKSPLARQPHNSIPESPLKRPGDRIKTSQPPRSRECCLALDLKKPGDRIKTPQGGREAERTETRPGVSSTDPSEKPQAKEATPAAPTWQPRGWSGYGVPAQPSGVPTQRYGVPAQPYGTTRAPTTGLNGPTAAGRLRPRSPWPQRGLTDYPNRLAPPRATEPWTPYWKRSQSGALLPPASRPTTGLLPGRTGGHGRAITRPGALLPGASTPSAMQPGQRYQVPFPQHPRPTGIDSRRGSR